MSYKEEVIELVECGIIRQALERGNPAIEKHHIEFIITAIYQKARKRE